MAAVSAGSTHRGRTPLVHPLWLRLTHWINALALLLLVTSGWRIYNASPIFEFKFPKTITLGGWLGGWNVSGILRYESGRPMTVTMTNDLAGLLFNTQKRPNQVGEGMADFGDFDPFEDRYYNRAGWADPGPLQFGNAPERDPEVRGFGNYSEDINIFKVFPISEQKRLRFELQIGNFFNRTIYCNPASNWSATDFGQVFTQCNTARSLQLGFRFDF